MSIPASKVTRSAGTNLIRECRLNPQPVRVIDIGAGQSHLVDRLLAEGYTISVLDISAAAIHATQKRMGSDAAKVHWIEGDITTLTDIGTFDVWHDRAVFHFLASPEDREQYVALLKKAVPRCV